MVVLVKKYWGRYCKIRYTWGPDTTGVTCRVNVKVTCRGFIPNTNFEPSSESATLLSYDSRLEWCFQIRTHNTSTEKKESETIRGTKTHVKVFYPVSIRLKEEIHR